MWGGRGTGRRGMRDKIEKEKERKKSEKGKLQGQCMQEEGYCHSQNVRIHRCDHL